jgi:hypothetical protein
MKNPLSEIYEKNVLLNEEKDNVVVPAGKMQISKGETVPLASTGGTEKVKKDIEDPDEHNEFSQEEKPMKENTETTKDETPSYEGAFEKLFKKTLTEDLGEDLATDMSVETEMPVTDEEMADEIEGDSEEMSDLTSDLQNVISSLQSILDKISGENENNEEGEGEEEKDYSEFEESVEAKELGHPLHNLKAGTELQKHASKEVKGAVKVSKGKASTGDCTSDPEVKPAKSHDKALQNPKTKPEVKSSVKKGDFFK